MKPVQAVARVAFLLTVLLISFHAEAQGGKDLPPAPRVVEDKNASEGWKRYQFAFDGGDTLSVVMPSAPQEYTARAQVASDVLLTMLTRTYAANLPTASFTALYASDLSIPAEKMSEKQRNDLYDAMSGQWAKGAADAFKQAGRVVEVKLGDKRPVTVSGHTGSEQDFVVGPFYCRARVVLSGRFVYMVLAAWTKDTGEALPNAFFDSFRVSKD